MLVAIQGEMWRGEIMAKLGLKDEKHFREHYQQAGISLGVIEMTIPDKPKKHAAVSAEKKTGAFAGTAIGGRSGWLRQVASPKYWNSRLIDIRIPIKVYFLYHDFL